MFFYQLEAFWANLEQMVWVSSESFVLGRWRPKQLRTNTVDGIRWLKGIVSWNSGKSIARQSARPFHAFSFWEMTWQLWKLMWNESARAKIISMKFVLPQILATSKQLEKHNRFHCFCRAYVLCIFLQVLLVVSQKGLALIGFSLYCLSSLDLTN